MSSFQPIQTPIPTARAEADRLVAKRVRVSISDVVMHGTRDWKHGDSFLDRALTAGQPLLCVAGTSQGGDPTVEMT